MKVGGWEGTVQKDMTTHLILNWILDPEPKNDLYWTSFGALANW
jgi:hypothetical protein